MKTPHATAIDMAKIQFVTTPWVVASITIPIGTATELETANANPYFAHNIKGRSGIIMKRVIPIVIAANISCKLMVHKAFQASTLVSSTPMATPSKTEWKHKATIKRMLSPSEMTVANEECLKWVAFLPIETYIKRKSDRNSILDSRFCKLKSWVV